MSIATLVRSGNWWYSKIPPLLGVGYAALLLSGDLGLKACGALLIAVFVSVVGVAAYGHVVNDVFDIEFDRRAGKPNRMARFRPWQRGVFCGGFLALGFVPALFVPYGAKAVLLLGLDYLLPTLYSVPVVRLKERGIWGALADAAAAHVIPVVFVMAVISDFAGVPAAIPSGFVALAVIWSACLGVRGILQHQLLDRPDDLAAGVSTLGTALRPQLVRRFLDFVAIPVEWAAFLGLVIFLFPVTSLLGYVLAGYIGLELMKTCLGWKRSFAPDGRETSGRHLPLANNAFYETWLPLVLGVELGLRSPALALVALFQVALFWRNFRAEARGFAMLLGRVRRPWTVFQIRRRLGFRLEFPRPNQARISLAGPREPGVRVEVLEAEEEPRHIRLLKPLAELAPDTAYRITFRARAVEPRPMMFVLTGEDKPWPGSGPFEKVELIRYWRTYATDFIAPSDGSQPCLSFWLGGHCGVVELASVSLLPIASESRCPIARHRDCYAQRILLPEEAERIRVEVLETDGIASHIVLLRPCVPVESGEAYQITFRAHAGSVRPMTLALAEGREPRTPRGLRERVELTPDWRTYVADFVAAGAPEDPCLAFWLGEQGGWVEVRDPSIQPAVREGTWLLARDEGCFVQRVPFPEEPDGVRLEVLEPGETPRHIRLQRPCAGVEGGQSYRVTFRARAENVRPATLSLAESREPWAGLGLHERVELTPDWRTYVADFTALEREDDARLSFWLGGARGTVELAQASLQPIAAGSAWRLMRREGSDAQRVLSQDEPDAVRVEILEVGESARQVRLLRFGIAMASAATYEIRFQARSDRPRQAVFGVWQAHEPWRKLGLLEALSLGPRWQWFEWQFVPSADDGDACLGFWLGGDCAAAEFKNFAMEGVAAGTAQTE